MCENPTPIQLINFISADSHNELINNINEDNYDDMIENDDNEDDFVSFIRK